MYWVRDGYIVTLANMPPFFQSVKPLNCVWHFELQILSWLPDFGGSLFITWDPLLTSQLEQRDWDLKLLPSENEAATLCNTALQNQKDEKLQNCVEGVSSVSKNWTKRKWGCPWGKNFPAFHKKLPLLQHTENHCSSSPYKSQSSMQWSIIMCILIIYKSRAGARSILFWNTLTLLISLRKT